MKTLQQALTEKGLVSSVSKLSKEELYKIIPNSSQGFASARIIMSSNCRFTFRVKISGYGFGNSCPYWAEEDCQDIQSAKEFFVRNLRQGWAISSDYEIYVLPHGTSFWSFWWKGGKVKQSETVDKHQVFNEFEEWFNNKLETFREAYSYIASNPDDFPYLTSEIDRYHPSVSVSHA